MRPTAPRLATSPDTDRTDYAAMSEALARLYRAAASTAADAVSALSANERARLAIYCYGRAHLNTIGLAIAAQCSLEQLVVAAPSPAAGQALYDQSRDAAAHADKRTQSRRAPITLATSAAMS